MRLRYRPLALSGFTVLAVLFLCIFLNSNASLAAVCAGALIFILSVFIKQLREQVFPFFLAASLILGGMLYIKTDDYGLRYARSLSESDGVHIEGVITDFPTCSDSRYYYILKLDSVDGEAVEFKMRLSVSEALDAEPYDRISSDVKLYMLGSSAGEDIERYFQSKNIYLGGYSKSYDNSDIVITKPESRPLNYRILMLRHGIETCILDKLPNEYGGTVIALLVGDKSFISDSLNTKLRLAGIAPVFAVSGLHLSIWVMGLYSLLEQLKLRRKINSAIGIAFTLFFMALTGFSPSVCRSGLMMLLLLSGNLFNRRSDSVNSLGFATLILCIINPFIVADTGFLMSFSATFGIITLYPQINRLLISKINSKTLKVLLSAVTVSALAIAGSLPVTVFFIGYISVFSVITNLLVTYAASVCMVLGGLTAVLFPISFISDTTALAAGLIAKYIIWVVEKFNELPLIAVSTADIFWKCGTVFAVAFVIFGALFLKKKAAVRFVSVGLSVVIVITSVCAAVYYNGLTQISVLNVENGIAVAMANGKRKVLLCGSTDAFDAVYTVEDELNRISMRNPDMILISDENAAENFVVLSTVKKFSFNNVIIPYSAQSVKNLCDGKMTVASDTTVSLWKNSTLEFHAREDGSYCYADIDGTTFFIVFSSEKNSEYDAKYLNADFLVCCEYIPNGIDVSAFGRVIVSCDGKTGKPIADYVDSSSGRAESTYELGNVYINVKNSKYKIYTKEG